MRNDRPKPSDFSEWIDFILLNGLTIFVIVLIFFAGGCGTGVGNPDGLPGAQGTDAAFDAPDPAAEPLVASALDFNAPIKKYETANVLNQANGVDCGSFTGNSSVSEVDDGRQCTRNAFLACTPSKYLLNRTNSDGSRFVSYVGIEVILSNPLTCQVRVHTVSNDSGTKFIGDEEKICQALNGTEMIELACGVGTSS
jgi:hypothetical protein